MATDFFERQDAARRTTLRLVVLFGLAVIAIVLSIHLLVGLVTGYVSREPTSGAIDWSRLLDFRLFAPIAVGTLLVVGGGSLFKMAQLRAGGRVIAEELGGRRLAPNTQVPSERQLLNVVEEMALAAGMPTPPVYLLDQEPGINAFAAGFTPTDAVIGVTQGSVSLLTRDELQGVMAHEFSHILNGDMRLNIRLIGLLHGILVIGLLGYFLLRVALVSGHTGRRSKRDGSPLPIVALGAGLLAIGFVGTFFGNLIKAGVSRQREFLADAAAVQFTRNPHGIAGALKKIGGFASGSRVRSPNAPEASHLFFGRGTAGFSALFSTHPPLALRIRRLDPAWDGEFPEVRSLSAPNLDRPLAPALAGVGTGYVDLEAQGRIVSAIDQIGQPGPAHLHYAAALASEVPEALTAAAHEPIGAQACVYALIVNREVEVRERQLRRLTAEAGAGLGRETRRLLPAVEGLPPRARLPLIEMALPALRSLSPPAYASFRRIVTMLAEADRAVDLFEWSLQRILPPGPDAAVGRAATTGVQYRTLRRLRSHCEILLSTLSYVGHRTRQQAERAFFRAVENLDLPPVRLLPIDACGIEPLDRAIEAFRQATPSIQRQVLTAAVVCIGADRQVTTIEMELVRAIAAALDCPMPPILVR